MIDCIELNTFKEGLTQKMGNFCFCLNHLLWSSNIWKKSQNDQFDFLPPTRASPGPPHFYSWWVVNMEILREMLLRSQFLSYDCGSGTKMFVKLCSNNIKSQNYEGDSLKWSKKGLKAEKIRKINKYWPSAIFSLL